jgi:hypothetical protein
MLPLAFPAGRLMGHEVGEIAIPTATSKSHYLGAAVPNKQNYHGPCRSDFYTMA